MATQKDIAEYLNISQQAVSVSLGNSRSSAQVSMETRRRVLEAAEKLGYVTNQLARSLKTGKTNVVGVVMPYCRDPYYSALIDALSMEAVRRKYSLMLQFHLWSEEEETAALQRLVEARVDGILFYPRGGRGSEELLSGLQRGRKVPVVAIASKDRENLFQGIVEKDWEEEGYQAAQEFLKLGHRRIDLLAARADNLTQRRRMKGAQLAVREAGVDAVVRHVSLTEAELAATEQTSPLRLEARDAFLPILVRHYLDEAERGTAVLVGNEAVAWKLLAEAVERGISVPDELSVIAVGVKGEGQAGVLPLTVVEYDATEIASAAFELLLDDRGPSYRVVPKLASRRSVANLAERLAQTSPP